MVQGWLLIVLIVLLLLFAARWLIRNGGVWPMRMADLSSASWVRGRRVVVTGGTAGIGLAACRGLQRMGARLVLGALNDAEANNARRELGSSVEVLPLDLTDSRSIEQFVASLEGEEIGALLFSAGVCSFNRLMLAVNFVGPVRLLNALRPRLSADCRVAILASDAHRLGELRLEDVKLTRFDAVVPSVGSVWSNQVNYGTTKLYLICYLLEHVRRHPGLRLAFVQPGAVFTAMGDEHAGRWLGVVRAVKRFLFKSPWQGAQTALHVLAMPERQFEAGLSWADCSRWSFVNPACFDLALQNRFYNAANAAFFY
jgi:NAD(P)-dependent dehydrogenase (short-subunit alcohol dehydrogenase family)